MGDELFNLVTFDQEAAAPHSFVLDKFYHYQDDFRRDDTLVVNEPVDDQAVLAAALEKTDAE
jgi:hypothetical protein